MGDEETVKKLQLQIEELKKQLAEARESLRKESQKAIKVKKAENELQESNRKLNTLINNLEGVVYRCKNDRDWTMEYISDAILNLSGYPASDFINNNVRTFNSIIIAGDRERLWTHWQEILKEKKYFIDEYKIVTSSGDIKWVWERGCGVYDNEKLIALEGFCIDITERKNAETELLKKEELLNLVGSMAKVGGWEFNVDTGEGSWTKEVAQIHDMAPEEPSNISLGLSFYTPESRLKVEKAIDEAIKKGVPYDLEIELITAKGVKKWVRTLGIPHYKNNRVVSIKGIVQDITERKETILKLENEKLRLNTLVETIPDMIWLKDPNGVYITCNPRFERFFGAKESEIKGRTDYDFMNKKSADFFRQKDLDAVLANKPTTNLEWVTYKDDGHRELLETIKTPMFDFNGKLLGVLGIARDITEKFQNEQMLKEKDLIFQSLLENSPVYIFFKDHNLKALQFSRNYEKMLGLPLEEIPGKDMNELFPPELAKTMVADDKRVLEEGKLVQVDEELNGKYYTTIKFPIFRDDNSPMLAGFTIDVTDQKKVQQELIIAKERAEESDKLKTAFLQNMSHEIRTPMNAIMGFSELLPGVFNDKENLEYYTKIINQRCTDLLGIIDEILDIARIESGHLSIHEEKCSLKTCFSELEFFFKEYQKRLKKEHLELNVVHSFTDADIVSIDQGKMKQILINLVSNAFKFTLEGKVEIACKYTDDNQLLFCVTDTGLGIPEENQAVIFDRFAQLNPTNYGGTGLGLAIVKGLLQAMGGKIWLESESKKGTTFYFLLPYKKSAVLVGNSSNNGTKQIVEGRARRILIVEDDHYNFVYLKELFRETSHQVIHAETGEQAIDLALKEDIDLVFMDIRLPDMDGYEATRIIRKHKPGLAIIAQTAYASENDKQNALAAGCDDYISKPIKYESFMKKINAYLY